MSNDKHGATFYPGTAPVYPLPQRVPLETMAAYGMPPGPGEPDRMVYDSPGPPPWATGQEKRKSRGLPAWAIVSMVLGGIFLCVGGSVAMTLFSNSGPVPAVSPAPSPSVATSGTCEKKIIGQYGLVATVTATNTTDETQAGTIWVRWPVTGEAAQEFTKRVTLKPGAAVEFPVNQDVPAELWMRTGACSFGWRAD